MSTNTKQRSLTDLLASLSRLGVVAEFTIGTSDVDATKDPDDTTKILGPLRDVQVTAGSGSLVYVDDVNGTTHTITGLSSTSQPITDMAIRTVNGMDNGTPSAGLTIRGRW